MSLDVNKNKGVAETAAIMQILQSQHKYLTDVCLFVCLFVADGTKAPS